MTSLLQDLRSSLTSLFKKTRGHIFAHPKKSGIFFAVLIVAFSILLTQGNGDTEVQQSEDSVKEVTLASVRALSTESQSFSFLGEVRSVSQAELRAQKSGKILRVYVTAGDFVQAGAILAEIDNSAERAMVLSAQGALQSALAQYEKTIAGARSEDVSSVVVQAQASELTLASAQDGARSAYSQAYTTAQDAVYAQADTYFSNPYTVNPTFRVRSATYDEKRALSKERFAIGTMLEAWQEKTRTPLADNELDIHLIEATENLERVKRFISEVSFYISKQEVDDTLTATQKATQEAGMAGTRASIDGARSAVNGARTGLANALGASQVARLTESKTVLGARSEDVAIAEAMVTQARGALASAYAGLENSLLRTPIAGTVSTFNVGMGDYVSMSETIAVVANDTALEVVAFVSDQARERIQVGDSASIGGKYSGTVTSIAPGLDPVTKKTRMTVGLKGEAPLSNGSYTRLILTPNEVTVKDDETITLSVPISAVKVLPRTLAVFTVDDEGVVTTLPITEGPITGERIIIRDGVTPETSIITDVRGITEGDVVVVLE